MYTLTHRLQWLYFPLKKITVTDNTGLPVPTGASQRSVVLATVLTEYV